MIKLTDKYYIGFQPLNYVLYEKRIGEKTGKEVFINIGYFCTIKLLTKSLLNTEGISIGKTQETLEGFIARMDAFVDKIDTKYDELFEGMEKCKD